MPDNKSIERMIADHGYTKTYVAKRLDVSRQAFSRKLHGTIRWSAQDILIIKDLFGLTSEEAFDIFFADRVDSTPTNA